MQRYHHTATESTNTWAKENIDLFHPEEITLVTADWQSHGHGRRGEKWHSPKDQNILATFIFFCKKEAVDHVKLVQLLAKEIHEELKTQGVQTTIKWPNDLQIKGKKVCGILCETVQTRPGEMGIVMGFGLNVNMPRSELDQVNQPATSLLEETGKSWDREKLLSALCKRFSFAIENF